MSIPEFVFTDDLLSGDPDCWGVIISAGIEVPQELFTLYDIRLSLPDYFGNNLDALDECLRDLGWLEADTRVVVQHADLPLVNDGPQCRSYLEMLRDSVRSWQTRGKERLTIVFPVAVEEQVQVLLSEGLGRNHE